MQPQQHIFEVELPTGEVLEIEAPETTAPDVIRARAKQYMVESNVPQAGISRPIPAGLQPPRPEDPRVTKLRQLMGIDPLNTPDRFLGAGQSVGKTLLAGVQWGQNMLGANVTPTPPWLEPKNQAQSVGQNIGAMAQYAAPAMATAGMSMPAQVLAGGLGSGLVAAGQGQDPETAAYIGMGAPILGSMVSGARNMIRAKDNPARALNATMEVSAKDIHPGVNPGKHLLDQGDVNTSNMGMSKEMLLKLIKIRQGDTEKALTAELSRLSNHSIEMSGLPGMETPQAQEVLAAMNKTWAPGAPLQMSPGEAHEFRSLLGDKINWSSTARTANDATGVNELLRKLYRTTNDLIDSVSPGTVKALNNKWANYHVGQNATKWAIRNQDVSMPGLPGSQAMSIAKRLLDSAPVATTYAPLSRALSRSVPSPGVLPAGMIRATILGQQ